MESPRGTATERRGSLPARAHRRSLDCGGAQSAASMSTAVYTHSTASVFTVSGLLHPAGPFYDARFRAPSLQHHPVYETLIASTELALLVYSTASTTAPGPQQ
jgi:hypothetical protein